VREKKGSSPEGSPHIFYKYQQHILKCTVTDEVLDAIEEKFIRNMDGPGGLKKQKGKSANKRHQSKNNDKIEQLINKLKFCK
jgi:hypothetical protein